MRKSMPIVAMILALLLLAACASSTATPTSVTAIPATAAAPDTSASSIPLAVSAANITVQDFWARTAVMTGAATAGDMGNHGTPEMSGTPMAGGMGDHATPEMSGTPMAGGMAHAGSGTSAAYMLITNSGATPDALIKAESTVADTVELHTMVMDGDVMRMTPIEKIDIPANGSVELKPGGLHVMLIGLRQDLKEGEVVKITLTFQNGGTIEIEAPVRMPPS